MATQNEIRPSDEEQMDLFDPDPVCRMEGCMHHRHFTTIRNMQAEIFKLQEKLRGYEES